MTSEAWDRWAMVAAASVPTVTVIVSALFARKRAAEVETKTLGKIAGVDQKAGAVEAKIDKQSEQNLVVERKVDDVHSIANARLTETMQQVKDLTELVKDQQSQALLAQQQQAGIAARTETIHEQENDIAGRVERAIKELQTIAATQRKKRGR